MPGGARDGGLLEISNYGKFEVTGPAPRSGCLRDGQRVPKWAASRSPHAQRARQADRDFTLCGCRRGVFLICTYAAQEYYRAGSSAMHPAGVTVRPCAMEYVGPVPRRPRSRSLLQG